ncbi:MAG: adenylate kinase family protein [Candidatus Hermodarchaeota archaeon]
MKIIIVSGTPGTGKTSISRRLSEIINVKVLTLNEIVISENLTIKYDKERDTYVIDEKKLISYIRTQINDIHKQRYDYLIIESHFSDIVPEEYVDLAIILRCDPDVLYQRLKLRGYKHSKIIENLQAEILGNSVNYFLQKQIRAPILEIETSNLSIDSSANLIRDLILERKNREKHSVGKIDWLEKLSQTNRLNEFFD